MISRRFIGHKLRVARTFQGLDPLELGERVGVGRTLIGQLEAGTRPPPPELVDRLAAALGFGARFFQAPFASEPRDEECHAAGSGPRRRALAHAALLAELVDWLDAWVQFPEESLPEIRHDGGGDGPIEDTVAACRRLWNLAPDLPIPNLVRVVERAGVVVARAPGAETCAHVGRRPLVVLNAETPNGGRLDLARLAGHVVLHRGADAGGASLAAEAERFAVALLLPREGLLRELPRSRSLDWEALAQLARRWNVSVAALVTRAAALPVANASRYREAADHLTTRERTVTTPLDEPPEVLALALERLARGRRIGRIEVARRLGWSPRVLAQVSGLEAGTGLGEKVISLAEWKARRPGAASSMPGQAGQLELDFTREL